MTDTALREHPLPKESTVKALYAHAFECARPDCHEWLYRQEPGEADPVLNSRVAHIHARRAGGPRWLEGMTAAENRSRTNLLVLCISHSYEIDDQAKRFPAELLQEWRADQRRVFEKRRQGWPLNDEAAREVLLLSFETPALRAQVLADVVRAAELLAVRAEATRAPVRVTAASWRLTWDRAQYGSFGVDAATGERIYAEPPMIDQRRHEAELLEALQTAHNTVQPDIEAVTAEVAVARAATPAASAWCEWVLRAAGDVQRAAGTWPGPPPAEDNDSLRSATTELRRAASALAARLRGDASAETPPEPPAFEAPAVESEAEQAIREHRELLERARPHSRVEHLPYNSELFAELVAAAELATLLPPVASFMGINLRATAGLAAAVARNASNEEMMSNLAVCVRRRPLVVAVQLLEDLARRCEQRGDAELAKAARELVRDEIVGQDWSQAEAWSGNEVGGEAIFWELSRLTSDDGVKALLSTALDSEPARLDELVLCCAPWIEHDSAAPGMERLERHYRYLPPWFPTEAAARAAATLHPDVQPAADPYERPTVTS